MPAGSSTEKVRVHRSRVGDLTARLDTLEQIGVAELTLRVERLEALVGDQTDGMFAIGAGLRRAELATAADARALGRVAEVLADPARLDAAREWARQHGVLFPLNGKGAEHV
jgi:hypothetical protein